MHTMQTKTLVGPRSFRATITRKAHVAKYTGEVLEPAEVAEFSAEDCTTRAAQRALFSDYSARAKDDLPRSTRVRLTNDPNAGWAPATPRFTAPARHKDECLLGRALSFPASYAGTFVPVGEGRSINTGDVAGVVWSLSPQPSHMWVYVAGSGFYSVPTARLFNAAGSAA